MKSILIWIMATRPQFLIASQLPVLLGTALAYYEQDVINGVKMLLTLLGISLCHAGFNILNDYYDHQNQADDLNKNPLTPFAGGSRMIQQGILSDKQMFYYGLILLGLAMILGIYLSYLIGWGIFYLGVLGMMMGFFYSAPPLSLHSRGLGELTVGLTFGVLTVSGAYYVQTEMITALAIYISFISGLFAMMILYINGFPDRPTDEQAGKRTLIVYLGENLAYRGFTLLLFLGFSLIILGVWLYRLPLACFFALLGLPFALHALRELKRGLHHIQSLITAIKNTILFHVIVHVGLIIGLLF